MKYAVMSGSLILVAVIATGLYMLITTGLSWQYRHPLPVSAPALTVSPGPMLMLRGIEECDLNADGHCDATDRALFQQALGATRLSSGYNSQADADGDGVITAKDQSILFPTTQPVTGFSITLKAGSGTGSAYNLVPLAFEGSGIANAQQLVTAICGST